MNRAAACTPRRRDERVGRPWSHEWALSTPESGTFVSFYFVPNRNSFSRRLATIDFARFHLGTSASVFSIPRTLNCQNKVAATHSLSIPQSRESSGPEKFSQRIPCVMSPTYAGISLHSDRCCCRICFSNASPPSVCCSASDVAAGRFNEASPTTFGGCLGSTVTCLPAAFGFDITPLATLGNLCEDATFCFLAALAA